MANGILGAIANPQIADIAGSLRIRQQQQQQQLGQQQALQDRQKQQQISQSLNDIFAERFTGKLADLSRLDAKSALQVAQATGIPVDQKGRQAHWFGMAKTMDSIIKSGGSPEDALSFLNTERAFFQDLIPTPRMDAFALKLQNDPLGAVQDIAVLTKAGELANILKSGKPGAPKQKTGAFLVKDPETGETSIATGVFDTETGDLQTATTKISGGQIVSKLGETAGEETKRKIEQQRLGKRAVGEEARTADLITRGVSAAEGTANVRRAIDLMGRVTTGGVDAISFDLKRRLGIEGADAGELSNSLGKAVLSQLKETFGAAFTVGELERLERIEGSFGKSVETNKRLLGQTLRIMERTAKRARKAALKAGDQDTVDDIDDLLSFSLNIQEPTKGPAQAAPAGQITGPTSGQQAALPAGLPQGTIDNGDGSFTLPTGERVVAQ